MYEKLFRSENPFWQGMERIFDLVELNLLWLVCCLPLVTAGPSTAALFAAVRLLARGEETYVHRDFFDALRRNFRRNAAAGTLALFVGAFLALDVRLAYGMGPGIGAFFMALFFGVLAFWALAAAWLFPLLSVTDGIGTRDVLILAFTLSLRRFFLTLRVLFAWAAALWLVRAAPALALAVFGPLAYLQFLWLAPALSPWLPPEPPGDGADAESTENG